MRGMTLERRIDLDGAGAVPEESSDATAYAVPLASPG